MSSPVPLGRGFGVGLILGFSLPAARRQRQALNTTDFFG